MGGRLTQAVPQCGHLDWCTSKLGMKWPRNATKSTTLEVGPLTPQLRLRLLENPYGIKGATRLLEAWEAPWEIPNLRNFSHKLILFARRQESPRGCGHSFPMFLERSEYLGFN